MIFHAFLIIIALYLVATLVLTYLVHQVPREPVADRPDWGHLIDTRIPAEDGGELEVWRIDPEGKSRGTVLLAHGWSRNRDRMVGRARVFGQMGFTTVLHSARDHGKSSKKRRMNAFRFAEDIETVMDWIGEPVLLYGHSIGAAAAVIAASRRTAQIRLLFLEGCYARTREAMFSLYRNQNRFLGPVFAPMVLLWMDIFYRFRLDTVSPVRLAPSIDLPVLIIHGGRDQNFPLHHAWRLRDSFPPGRAELFVSLGSDHSSSSLDPVYPDALHAFVERHLPA
ncbi:MAG: alpha/beta hydrolase [Deltaproteobacteria bacterium]|nr:alpha/beta hydrolase [Deltaproteobacteria bacterium]